MQYCSMTDDYDEVKDSGNCRLVSRNRSRSEYFSDTVGSHF